MADSSNKYICGVEFFRPVSLSPGEQPYFRALQEIFPLLTGTDFKEVVLRFYFNEITDLKDFKNSLRLVYDTLDPIRTQKIINEFVERNKEKLAIFECESTNRPNADTPMNEADPGTLRFRNFLHVNTIIFLDLIQIYNLRQLQELIHRYRYTYLPHRVPPEAILGEAFGRSKYFQGLKNASLDKQYWLDLTHKFNKDDFGLHFLVNMSSVDEWWGYEPFFGEDWILRQNETH